MVESKIYKSMSLKLLSDTLSRKIEVKRPKKIEEKKNKFSEIKKK
jgi:hypothetical protein